MKTIKVSEKEFDSIKIMRQIRDEISAEIMDMDYNEEKEFLSKLLSENKAYTTARARKDG